MIGQPGSRERLNTPALIVDLDALEANIAAMAAFGREAGIALRPHAKTHKSADIGRMQVAAGAVGLCCAKLGEAEALAAEGIGSILLTSPVVAAPAIARLVALAERIDLAVVADHPDAVAALAAANTGRPIRVLVDIDPGIHRTGVASATDAVALARQIADAPQLSYGGVQFYCGSLQHIPAFADRRAAVAERTAYLQTVIAALTDAGLAPPVVTGGGTGTHRIDAELGVLTELQVGSYVFMDREYGDCDLGTRVRHRADGRYARDQREPCRASRRSTPGSRPSRPKRVTRSSWPAHRRAACIASWATSMARWSCPTALRRPRSARA